MQSRGSRAGNWRAHLRLNHTNLRTRLLDSRTWAKPSDHRHEVARPKADRVSGIVVQGNPYLRFRRRETEFGWHDANHLTALAFQFDRLTESSWVASEPFHP